MDDQYVISKVNGYLHSATQELCKWLYKMLPRITDDWWNQCVIMNLSYSQRLIAEEKGFAKLEDLDLAALLRVADKSWYDMREFAYLPTKDRECLRAMTKVRNNWAHSSGTLPDKDVIVNDLTATLNFFENVIVTNIYSQDINECIKTIEGMDFSLTKPAPTPVEQPVSRDLSDEIHEKDQVIIVGEPDKRGMVFAISEVGGIKKYDVFVDGNIKPYYDGQIQKYNPTPDYKLVSLEEFQSLLTAYEINNPSSGNLYSLNAARIDFVPYQFRPALKMIKSDVPKILVADSVGVGKTIEAGLIIKELEARTDLDNILIICPKPLVSERKWELEMKRFDEEFIPLTGQELRQVLSDTHRDEEWPSRYNKAIIPYSILDSKIYEGNPHKGGRSYGLLELDPPPHFNLVIIDEAHHIRNGSLEKEKAYAYKCVRYFCEHADAVVMLTATPLQTSDDDLYTLLNLLRPDVVMDKETFKMMSNPNEYIYRASHAARSVAEDWQHTAISELQGITATQWGENVISKNPLYIDILNRLNKPNITREERVKLITDIESLHSFAYMINRTRRKDIQDFCVRRPFTISSEFTDAQEQLYSELMEFEQQALSCLHDPRTVPFMMSTIKRQAASCIFGLAPHIRDIINRRFIQLSDDITYDPEGYDISEADSNQLKALAQRILDMADNLPDDDPKIDSLLSIIDEKQKQENNKIILFSTFRHTLGYVKQKLLMFNYRVAQIDGSVKDEDRRQLRARFELDKSDPAALDILLFTEVGSEGLDYQFCDTMINYDLPWNPMRIEQRIGRIDRRGQKSEVVSIYNLITLGTVDADIYDRCLSRIGVFENSIGECEEILGSIANQIEQVCSNTSLTDEERRVKLEQIADNEVRKMQEMTRLEDEERALFGFDLSNMSATQDIKDADSPWISPENIQKLIERYLEARLGFGQYILGSSEIKQLRLNQEGRSALLEDFRKLSNTKSYPKRTWELYLKGGEPIHKIVFNSEAADSDRKAFFITPMHPLVKQAAKYFATSDSVDICIDYYSDSLPTGEYNFSVYAWNYVGMQPKFKVVPVCDNDEIADNFTDILMEATVSESGKPLSQEAISVLESKQIPLWQEEKAKYLADVANTANYKLESIGNNYRNRKRALEQKIRDINDEKIVRMYQSELSTATDNYERKVQEINSQKDKADIHTILVAKGVISIKRS